MRKLIIKSGFLLLTAIVLSGCGAIQLAPAPTPTLDRYNPEFTISMDEFSFTPDHIRLVVGQEVTMHIVNNGEEEHEIMIGRNTIRDENGELEDGFQQDFFALTTVAVEGDAQVMGMNGEAMDMGSDNSMDMGTEDSSMDMGSGDSMDMGTEDSSMDMATETPMDSGMESSSMGGEEMAHGGMIMLDAKGEATVTFTVTEEMEGAWTIGCFEGSTPRHYDLGMAGILYVLNFND